MNTSEGQFKVTVECRSAEAAQRAANKLEGFNKNVTNVIVKIVGNIVYMTFSAISSYSLTILGSIKDLLGMSYKPSISPAT
jgi:hypothetical protein